MEKEKSENEQLVHAFKSDTSSVFSKGFIVTLLVVAIVGIGSGYLLSHNTSGTGGATSGSGGILSGSKKVVGSNDMETFKDIAEGKLEKGGLEGEGQYHLVRPGGDSQNVYLTSSIIDLSEFVGKKIKVWGQTQKAIKASWLMDVGKVEALE